MKHLRWRRKRKREVCLHAVTRHCPSTVAQRQIRGGGEACSRGNASRVCISRKEKWIFLCMVKHPFPRKACVSVQSRPSSMFTDVYDHCFRCCSLGLIKVEQLCGCHRHVRSSWLIHQDLFLCQGRCSCS